jgi:hypothetical protein
MPTLADVLSGLQQRLFPLLEEELGPLSKLDQQFTETLALVETGELLRCYEWSGKGCPPHARASILRAFLAKSVYQFPTTSALRHALCSQPTLRRLCGWESAGEIPSEATFSRAFAQFATDEVPSKVHVQLVVTHAGQKLVGHVSRDATAISVPERATPKPVAPVVPKAKRGRPAKGEVRAPAPPKRLSLQPGRTLEENLSDLPTACTVGAKRNSQGHESHWVGYKLHVDTIDGDIPVSVVLTSASLHDSQVAIPLAQMTAQRVHSLYDLMDSAYDMPEIADFSRGLGHVPIIDAHRRKGQEKPVMEPAQARRFDERTSAERVNSLLKGRYGAGWIRVRGHAKVLAHLMFGIVALTVANLCARII